MTKTDKFNSIMHSWGTPLLHMLLWAMALIITQNAEDWFSKFKEYMDIIQFGLVFIVFFVEIVITLIDAYVARESENIASTFILFSAIMLLLVLVTAISVVCAIIKMADGNIERCLQVVIVTSSILKLIEILLANNGNWFAVKATVLYDACEQHYNRRNLN